MLILFSLPFLMRILKIRMQKYSPHRHYIDTCSGFASHRRSLLFAGFISLPINNIVISLLPYISEASFYFISSHARHVRSHGSVTDYIQSRMMMIFSPISFICFTPAPLLKHNTFTIMEKCTSTFLATRRDFAFSLHILTSYTHVDYFASHYHAP